jgi:hypothetical protein
MTGLKLSALNQMKVWSASTVSLLQTIIVQKDVDSI